MPCCPLFGRVQWARTWAARWNCPDTCRTEPASAPQPVPGSRTQKAQPEGWLTHRHTAGLRHGAALTGPWPAADRYRTDGVYDIALFGQKQPSEPPRRTFLRNGSIWPLTRCGGSWGRRARSRRGEEPLTGLLRPERSRHCPLASPARQPVRPRSAPLGSARRRSAPRPPPRRVHSWLKIGGSGSAASPARSCGHRDPRIP